MSYLCFFILSVYEFILNDETAKVITDYFGYIYFIFQGYNHVQNGSR